MTFKQKLVRIIVFFRIYHQWKRLARKAGSKSYQSSRTPSLVIVPCDPWSVGGSRGDEAMLMAVIDQYRQRYPDIPVHIVCADDGFGYIRNLPLPNLQPISSWNGNYPLDSICKAIVDTKPTDVVVLGADCIDGHYNPSLSLMLLSIYDVCRHLNGVRSRLLGFSFNDHPSWLMLLALKSLNDDVCLNLRDDVSLARYRKKVHRPSRLVADAAFMLQPKYGFALYDEIKQWTDLQRSEGQTIIGLNFHPMLRSYSGADEIKADAIILAKNIAQILHKHTSISFVFIPHDDRSRITDNLMLSTMYDYLKKETRIFYSPEVPRAPQLKALCGLLDGLISSRMHLAIAALGMNVPVMAATYQGKFEGLFHHFSLYDKYLLTPDRFLSQEMIDTFSMFVEELPILSQQVAEKMPEVLEKSKLNLADE